MDRERPLDRLVTYMQRVLDILAEGRGSLGLPEATRWKALALARWQMLHALRRFIDFKQKAILDPLIARSDGLTARRADALKHSNERLWQAYDAFVSHWAMRSPLSVDATYKSEALKMGERIEETVIADVQEIERLAHSGAPHPGGTAR